MRFYHGTSIPLNVGDMLLPPTVTGAESLYRKSHAGRVYASTRFDVAVEYADYTAIMKDGEPVVYEVAPVGEYETDPHDENDGTYYRATAWTVTDIHYL